MSKTKIVFMGTPIFAAKILENLITNNFNIVGVVSQPDRKKNRKGELLNTPSKEIALKNSIKVYQPNNIKEEISFLEDAKPDLIITAAYGQIVPNQVLDYPKYGCINVHGSLLPKYRGGAPIHYAILNGDEETGVTIMEMVSKMDAGNIISQQKFTIKKDDILEEVHDNMIEVAQQLLIKTLPSIIKQNYVSQIQKDEEIIFSPNIKRIEENIDWTMDGIEIYNKIRAFNSWPVAYAIIHNKRFKFYKTRFTRSLHKEKIGEIINIDDEGIKIAVKNGHLKILEFQIEGKKKVEIKDFINGNNFLKIGDNFEI